MVIASALFGTLSTTMAGPPEVVKREGHTSPLMVEVTSTNGKVSKGMLLGIQWNSIYSHQYMGFGPGKKEVTIWLDTLAEIKDITDEEATFVFKDGDTLTIKHDKNPSTPKLVLRLENDAQEVLELERLKRVKFLKPARKDSEDHAMFDHWKYSPYTGEELPKG